MEAKSSSGNSSSNSGSRGGGVKVQKPTKVVVRYKGLIDCLYSIARTEGVPGLYKGLTPSLLLVSHGAIQFTCYENLKSLARGEGGGDFLHQMMVAKRTTTMASLHGTKRTHQRRVRRLRHAFKNSCLSDHVPATSRSRSNAKTSNRTKPD